MRIVHFFLFVLVAASGAAQAQSQVIVNREELSEQTVQALEQRYRIQIQEGAYWYDAATGAWGLECGPALGLTQAGLDLGGTLRRDASCGHTGVVINNRELHPYDVAGLQQLVGAVYPGRYWMDAAWNVGLEGGPVLVNLAQLAQQRGGSTFYRSGNTGYGSGSSGDTFYVMGKDWSVTVSN